MKQKTRARKPKPSRLQRDLLPRIVDFIRDQALPPGTRLAEIALAEHLQVSRTPVRAALAHLAARGLVERGARRGYFVGKEKAALDAVALDAAPGIADRVFIAIARDRLHGRLPVEVSEADLMRRYSVTRPVLQRVLTKLAEVALAERKPGHGWRFLAAIRDDAARHESYRFRLLIEPAALLEPSFRLDPAWIARMRQRHQAMLKAPWNETLSIALFEMNAEFHEGLVAAAGNRYLLTAIQQQNRLRRFYNYDWVYGHERVVVSCREHLEILDRLEAGEREIAAALLRRHLDQASRLKRAPVAAVA
jgi:DNA-binding GntR family transcriptional regulator